ncbi:MAG: hypothetical protein ABI579_02605 [Candidatus Sumerlaeota bacterium]
MPRYRFQAIDETGRVVRGVLRADGDDSARDILRDEALFPKTLDAVSEDEKITWSPRNRIKAAAQRPASVARNNAPPRIVRAPFDTECLRGFEHVAAGEAGLADDDRFVFQPKGAAALTISADEVEQVSIAGLLSKRLSIVLVSGKSYEFTAGTIFSKASAKLIASTLSK